MSGIICWIFTLAIPVLQFDLAQWRNDLNKIQGRASHSNIATYDESYWQDAVVRINFSEPGEETLRKSRSMEIYWRRRTDQGDLIKPQIYLKPLIITSMSNSWKASLQHIVQNWLTTVLGLLKSGKLKTTTYDRSKRPDTTFCRMVRKVRPDHEEILDGTAQSVTGIMGSNFFCFWKLVSDFR